MENDNQVLLYFMMKYFREEKVVKSYHVRDPAAPRDSEGSQWVGDSDHHQPEVPRYDPLLQSGQVSDCLET